MRGLICERPIGQDQATLVLPHLVWTFEPLVPGYSDSPVKCLRQKQRAGRGRLTSIYLHHDAPARGATRSTVRGGSDRLGLMHVSVSESNRSAQAATVLVVAYIYLRCGVVS